MARVGPRPIAIRLPARARTGQGAAPIEVCGGGEAFGQAVERRAQNSVAGPRRYHMQQRGEGREEALGRGDAELGTGA